MKIKELQQLLHEAYAIGNLNKITLTLIGLYKNQQYGVLQKIAEIISDFVNIEIADDGKGFSRLMMLYHPDRAGYHLGEINRLSEQGNFNGLLEYSHILKLERIDEIAQSLNSYGDIDYSPVYEWDFETEGFSIINDSQPVEIIRTRTTTKVVGCTFYDAIRIREYGDIDFEYPSFYLEESEEIELSSSSIDDLDGAQFCINAKTIDLSNNLITDLTPLAGLKNLEALDLSENQIAYIDVLATLTNLKNVILSGNCFEDLSPLFGLEKLEYVDVTGNRIDIKEIEKLTESGVEVDY